MITSIKLANLPPYASPVSITPARINYFYGSNGSGKSSIAKYLSGERNGEQCETIRDASDDCEILTYNRTFVENNFRNDGMPGIFTLGAESVEIRELIAKKREEIDSCKRQIDTSQRNIDLLYRDIEVIRGAQQENCWQSKQQYEKDFPLALAGFRGSKEKFYSECLRRCKQENEIQPLSIEKLRIIYNAAYTKDIQEIAPYSNIDVQKIVEIEQSQLLTTIITGRADTPVGRFIDALNAGDWVKQGVAYITPANGKCPFCQRDMSEELAASILDYFDETYSRDCGMIEEMNRLFQTERRRIIRELDAILASRINGVDYASFEAYREEAIRILSEDAIQLEKKLASPSIIVTMGSIADVAANINNCIDAYNQYIMENNRLLKDQTQTKKECVDAVWNQIILEVSAGIKSAEKQIAGKEKGVSGLFAKKEGYSNQITKIEREIHEEEDKLTSVAPTASAINGILHKFGFCGFSVAENEKQNGTYRIVRDDGTDAQKTLSEGEYTFITFLYYYNLCFGSHNSNGIAKNRILVIDDPISSLDSTVLFVVATMVKDIIAKCRNQEEGIKQVFILTHNVHFHKEITFIGNRSGFAQDEARFYIVYKRDGISSIAAYDKNPIKSSYELLWNEVKDDSHTSREGVLNAMRRILEHYFQVIGGLNYEKCIAAFEGEDKILCQSLVAYINDGSHSVFDDIMVALDDSIIEKYRRVFRLIFEKLNQIDHYKMMMGIDT